MSRAMGHLYFNTDQEEKKYGFRDRCSRLVELEETITFPDNFKPLLPDVNKTTSGNSARFSGGYRIKGNSIQLNQEIVLGKRIYEAADWNEFREAVKGQKKISEMPVVLKKSN
jgi:hypothetical protein